MEEIIGKSTLIKRAAKNAKLNQEICTQAINSFLDEIICSISNGEKISLKNFMTIEVIERAAREGRDFKTGEKIVYPPVKSVKCKISKAVKNAINEKGSA